MHRLLNLIRHPIRSWRAWYGRHNQMAIDIPGLGSYVSGEEDEEAGWRFE